MLVKDAVRLILEHSCLEQRRQRVYRRNWDKIESARITVAMAVYDIVRENKDEVSKIGLEYMIKNTLRQSFSLQTSDPASIYMTDLCLKVCDDPSFYEERLGDLRTGKEAARFLSSKKRVLKIDTALYTCMWEIIASGSLASTMWKIALDIEGQFTFFEYCIAYDLIPWITTHPKYSDVYDVVLMGIESYHLKLCRYCNRTINHKNKNKNKKSVLQCLTCKQVYYCSKTCKHVDSTEEIGHVKLECRYLSTKK